jgi:hypothetical protein
MSIEVTGPDGAIHEFPDDTSTDVIKGAVARHYGSPAGLRFTPGLFSNRLARAAYSDPSRHKIQWRFPIAIRRSREPARAL